MGTFLLTWNRTLSEEWGDREYEIDVTALGYRVNGRWSTGNSKSIEAGDRVFLLQQGDVRGIVASGFATSSVSQKEHFHKPNEIANYVDIEWDCHVADEDMIPTEDLERLIPNVHWSPMTGGIQIHEEEDVKALEYIWEFGVEAVDGYRAIEWKR
jgi:hypothetical protein